MQIKLKRLTNGQLVTLDTELGSGGEGKIYAVSQEPSLVAKIYHQPKNWYGDKLKVMLANPPDDPTALHWSFD